MKLNTLQIFPQGANGWGCEPLQFSKHITHIFGPNGCGKTPIVQSIAYCLGYPSVFRKDIYERCSHVSLSILFHKDELIITRQYSREVEIEVNSSNGMYERFYSEKEFTEFMFQLIGIEYPNLVSNKDSITKPYLSTLLPLLYTDQDAGYTSIYFAPHSFIKDQFEEMMRILFLLPPRNSFDSKKAELESKKEVEYFDYEVNKKENELKFANDQIESFQSSHEELMKECKALEKELEILSQESSTKDDSLRAIDNIIYQHNTNIINLERELSEIKKRKNSISIMTNEIHSEIDALGLNEASRRIFLSFNEICSSSNCQLFTFSSDSYAKNLLYLKDQIKDLERNEAIYAKNEDKIISQINETKLSIKKLIDERNESVNKSEISSIVTSVSELKNRIFFVQSKIKDYDRLREIEKGYVEALSRRNSALDRYESFKRSSSSIPKLSRIKSDLRKLFIKWLDKLHTANISTDITFRNQFEPVLGDEKIAQLKGSTKVRAILAFHASVIELLVNEKSHLGLLILDTPKQHEINNDDLDRYFHALKDLCVKGNVQIIFSTTEYQYSGDENDTVWVPNYPGKDQKMFLLDKSFGSSRA